MSRELRKWDFSVFQTFWPKTTASLTFDVFQSQRISTALEIAKQGH